MIKRLTNKLTDTDIARIIELRKKGYSLPMIGEQFGVHHSTVLHHLRRVGINKRFKKPILKKIKLPKQKRHKSYLELLEAFAHKQGKPMKFYLYKKESLTR